MNESYGETNLQHYLSQLRSEASTDRLAGANGLAVLALRAHIEGAARTRRASSSALTEGNEVVELFASVKPALGDPHMEVRRSLAFALGELKNNSAFEMLAALATSDPESAVRAEAIDAIAKIGGLRTVKTIQEIVENDRSIEVRLRGVRALTELTRREPVFTEIISKGLDQLELSQHDDLVRKQCQGLRNVLR